MMLSFVLAAATVAQPLETQFAQMPGVSQLTSQSSLGQSQITIQFGLDRNIDGAANDGLVSGARIDNVGRTSRTSPARAGTTTSPATAVTTSCSARAAATGSMAAAAPTC